MDNVIAIQQYIALAACLTNSVVPDALIERRRPGGLDPKCYLHCRKMSTMIFWSFLFSLLCVVSFAPRIVA